MTLELSENQLVILGASILMYADSVQDEIHKLEEMLLYCSYTPKDGKVIEESLSEYRKLKQDIFDTLKTIRI